MIKYGLSNRYKVDPYGTEEILSGVSNSVTPKLTIDYGDEVQEAEFTIRPTKGSLDTNISPIAVLNSIKGNTRAWNQLVQNGDFSNGTNGWNVYSGTPSVSNNTLTVTGAVGRDGVKLVTPLTLLSSHLYYYRVTYCSDVDLTFHLVDTNIQVAASSTFTTYSDIGSISYDSGNNCDIFPTISGQQGTFSLRNINVIDLTLIYGSGNEPETAAEFEADYYKWFGKPLSYEAYDTGSLRSVKMTGLKTTGFNLWDTSMLVLDNEATITKNIDGSIIIEAQAYQENYNYLDIPFKDKVYHIEFDYVWLNKTDDRARCDLAITYTNGYDVMYMDGDVGTVCHASVTTSEYFDISHIKFGDWAYAGSVKVYNICINLHHSGDRDGEYEPYWSSLLNVPITTMKGRLNGEGSSTVIFSDGMKSAGNVRDEIKIENNKLKGIKRVGTRPYEVGDVNSSTMTTDGINYTNYALTTSEEYIIDDVNVEKVMLGNTEVTKVYLGNQLIFEESN